MAKRKTAADRDALALLTDPALAGLTDKQRLFVLAYAERPNGTAAARTAGYGGDDHSLASIAFANLRKVEIRDAVDGLLSARVIGKPEALARLSEQGRNVQMEYLLEDGSIDLAGLLGAGLGHLVKGTKHDKDGRLQVEFFDAQTALVTTLKAHGAFPAPGGATVNVQVNTDARSIYADIPPPPDP